MRLSIPTDCPTSAIRRTGVLRLLVFCVLCLAHLVPSISAADVDDATLLKHLATLATEDADARAAAMAALVDSGDGRFADAIEFYGQGSLYLYHDAPVIGRDIVTAEDGTKSIPIEDPLTHAAIGDGPVPLADLQEMSVSRKDRLLVRDALVVLRLADPRDDLRLQAVSKAGDSGDIRTRAALAQRQSRETNTKIKHTIAESLALIDLAQGESDDIRIAAAGVLADLKSARGGARMTGILTAKPAPSPAFKTALTAAVARIDSWQSIARGFGHVFSGLSLGSILILMALGLSIIFGLMGVINMAHGEMMMIGAYSMWAVQQLIGAGIAKGYLPAGLAECALLIAIPISFLASGLIGWIVEACIIRYLYGRPLDTLLATVGVSYCLIQGVRLLAGDNNAVQSPTWLQGGWEIAPSIILPYNRLFIIALCTAIVVGMHLLINRTKMGLLLRATTQNRQMAQTLGVRTRRVDGLTFALGCGIAGMAGCALTLTDILKPDMGSSYIIESFMVVTAGGVGKLAGAVVAGFGLGFLNKALEPIFAAVWAKVWMLSGVIILLQYRPSGLFPAKGRLADV